MNALAKTFATLCAAMIVSLTGCAALPTPSGSAPAPGKESSPTEEGEQQFFDNLVILRAGLVGLDPETDTLEQYPDQTWSESDPSVRKSMVELGTSACETPIPASPDEPGDRYTIWLSARFLCEDRLPEAEAALEEFTNEQMVQLLEYSLWRGDALPDDVLTALTLCTAELAAGWVIPEETFPTREYFCWFVRANAIEHNDSEQDFIEMFQEGGSPEFTFEEYALDLGARQNAILDSQEPQPQ